MKSWQDFEYVLLVSVPLFLFSGTFYPLSVYPHVIGLIVEWTPLYQGVVILRDLVLGAPSPDAAVAGGVPGRARRGRAGGGRPPDRQAAPGLTPAAARLAAVSCGGAGGAPPASRGHRRRSGVPATRPTGSTGSAASGGTRSRGRSPRWCSARTTRSRSSGCCSSRPPPGTWASTPSTSSSCRCCGRRSWTCAGPGFNLLGDHFQVGRGGAGAVLPAVPLARHAAVLPGAADGAVGVPGHGGRVGAARAGRAGG